MGADLFDDATEPIGLKLGPVIEATYNGTCNACGWEIETGQDIRADGEGGWIHAVEHCERLAK